MQPSTFFSIVCPVYRAEVFLPACIESVQAQTDADWELLLIDDGSPDRSGLICDEYASRDSRIRVFHQANAGVSTARNMGIDHATGRWILFLDSDDRIQPSTLAAIRNIVSADDHIDLVQYDFRRTAPGSSPAEPVVNAEQVSVYPAADYIRTGRHLVTAGGECISTRLVRQAGLHFRPDLKMAEDQLFVLEAMAGCRRIARLSAPLYLYTDNPAGGLSRCTLDNIRQTLAAYDGFVCRYPCFERLRDLMSLNFAMQALRRRLCPAATIRRDILPSSRLKAIRNADIQNRGDRLFHRLARINYPIVLHTFRLINALRNQ